MSRLALIRHAQASFLADDYDQLSTLGYEQAYELGRYWRKQARSFDHVFTGTLKRQLQTERAVAEIYSETGLEWPQPASLQELDEYPAEDIYRALLPQLRERDSRVAALAAEHEAAENDPTRYRALHKLLEAVIAAWVEGAYEGDRIKPWPGFRDGVRTALKHILKLQGSGLDVAVFTSGGPIAVCVQSVLGAPDRSAAALHWRIHNCSLTHFTFSRARISLDCFNTVAHLTEPVLLTYR